MLINPAHSPLTLLPSLRWNPAVEDQAIERVHRIGQTRPVSVYRFLVKDSVEEHMAKISAKKAASVQSMGVGESRLTATDIASIFQIE